MRTGMNMTIQDYFKRSGIKSPMTRRVNEKEGNAKLGGNAFSQALVEAQTANAPKLEPQGLGIRDYVARPVRVIRSLGRHPGVPTADRMISTTAKTTPRADGSIKKNEPSPPHGMNSPQETVLSEKDTILKSIDEAANRYNLSPSLIRAVVQAESDYQVRAISPAGAQGLMQLMPATAKELGVQNPFDIGQNIDGGAKYLRQMLDKFDGNIETALSAYNAGPGTVAKYNGNVPYTETRNYVQRVMRFSRQFS